MQKPRRNKTSRSDAEKAANIVRDAGGRVVGRTRLQKVAYLLELAGFGEGFAFSYHHYGPYSEQLNLAIQIGGMHSEIIEEERAASWGGRYSIFTCERSDDDVATEDRKQFAKAAAEAEPVELELAATAAFLHLEGFKNAWMETAKRKPEKSHGGRLTKAKLLYSKLAEMKTPKRLPILS